jgi:beta-xylosidase
MTYTNPVMNDNRPDPGILKLDSGGFVVVTTSDHAKAGIDPALPIIFSKDLINWKQV